MRGLAALLLGGALVGCMAHDTIQPVSIIELIAGLGRYSGQRVRVIGFVTLEFESSGICLHEADVQHNITKNCLWLEPSDELRRRKAEFDKHYLLVEGTFYAEDKGRLEAASGSLSRITKFALRD